MEQLAAPPSPPAVRVWRSTAIFFLIAFALVFGAFSVGRKVQPDENVFIASATLLSRHFLLPYRDYHYNHMPTLLIIYALLFRVCSYLLLTARTFCALCAAGAAALFFYFAYQNFDPLAPRRRMAFSVGIAALFLADPLFTHTAGRAWNHDFPVLMSLLGFVTLSRGLELRRWGWLALAGFLVGLAVTARLTFATELLPFYLFVLFYPKIPLPRRIGLFTAFTIGGIIALIPSLWIWAQSPINAYFGNFQYPAFNTQWHFLHDDIVHQRHTLPTKLWFFIKKSWELPGNGVVMWGFVALCCLIIKERKSLRDPWRFQLAILVLLICSQIAAGLVPSPPFEQYFYAPTPFMFLAIILCLSKLPGLASNFKLDWIWIAALTICVICALPEYRGLPYLFWPPAWFPVRAHELGVKIAQQTGDQPVLTLDPLYVLEGGADIYPALATGCFGIRVGDYLTPAQRTQYKMWGSNEIRDLFAKSLPPVMISPGSDGDYEALFINLAKANGYHEVDVNLTKPGVIILWLPPATEKALAGSN
jgi:hypothetical protein